MELGEGPHHAGVVTPELRRPDPAAAARVSGTRGPRLVLV